jgi:hypothetical protein
VNDTDAVWPIVRNFETLQTNALRVRAIPMQSGPR